MNAQKIFRIGMGIAGTICVVLIILLARNEEMQATVLSWDTAKSTEAEQVSSPFHYRFTVNGTLNETGSMDESSSPYFWLNSGGQLRIEEGVGKTLQGKLDTNQLWHKLYARNNSLDTENGDYPQNLFRLITRSEWDNTVTEVHFLIKKINAIDSPNRDAWSGVFLMNRYKDSDNLYYAGVRMDGTAVIKKKYEGTYYTLAQESLPYATSTYDRTENPNLIPEGQWISLRTETVTSEKDTVTIILHVDSNNDGDFEYDLIAIDPKGKNGEDIIKGPAYVGIRTDYVDVFFDDLIITTFPRPSTSERE